MKHLTTIMQRGVVGIFALLFVVSGVYSPLLTPRAHALMPVIDAAAVAALNGIATVAIPGHATAVIGAVEVAQGVETADDIKTSVALVVKQTLDGLAWTIAKVAVQSMTKSIVNWINGGFEGSPAFATDLQTNLRQFADATAQQFLTDLATNAKINSPFLDNLVTNVGAAYYLYSGRDALAAQLRDTLGDNSPDPAAFRRGDFSQGGWSAYISQVTNDANNPIGARMIASQALAARISAAAMERTQELSWGNGFLSWKGDCIRTNANTPAGAHTNVGTTQGTTGGPTGTSGHTGNTGTGGTGATNTGGSTTGGGTSGSAHSLSDAEGCIEREIQTPGSVIEGALIQNVNSPLHQLELADSFNEIIAALAQQLVSKVIGSEGLRSVSRPSSGGGQSALDQASDPSQFAPAGSSLSQGFQAVVSSSQSQMLEYQSNWQRIKNAAEGAKTSCQNNPDALANPIQTTLDKANTELARAAEALATLTDIDAGSSTTTGGGGVEQVESIASSTYAYQTLSLPSASEISYASVQSQPTVTGSPQTLFSLLTALSTGNCGFVLEIEPFDPRF